MKRILIEISSENYTALVSHIPPGLRVTSLLKNSVCTTRSVGAESEIFALVCDQDEAETLLQAARWFWPNASFDIQDGIKLSRSI